MIYLFIPILLVFLTGLSAAKFTSRLESWYTFFYNWLFQFFAAMGVVFVVLICKFFVCLIMN